MTFLFNADRLPRPFDANMAQRYRTEWQERAAEQDDPALTAFMQGALSDAQTARLLDAVFGNSPYLSDCLMRAPGLLRDLLALGADGTRNALFAEVEAKGRGQTDTAALMRDLRIAKRRLALLAGLADIAQVWPLESVTQALSRMADVGLSLASAHLLRRAHDAGDLVLPHPDEPEKDSGLLILGMGKLGGFELNYSSDIDIIVFYDEDKVEYRGRRSVQELFVKIARELVRIMEERTIDGYVFRTDLRLRPDPGSTPAAISILAAETYYECFGQNWERAAMIKARQVAGDVDTGTAFLRFLRPFIWRKHLDFAAIQDIHSIKRQINAHKGGGKIAVAGHNIKLGRGGIREVEFFAQTQQLIWGGRDPDMRTPRTCDALAALARTGHVEESAAAEMDAAYHYLRGLEHRLQMTDDKQTQTLPEDPQRLEALAVFAGYEGIEDFSIALRQSLQTVEAHYARLFEDSPELSAAGDLVFTGGENDPGTISTLMEMGFAAPDTVCGQIRGWHHGRVRATRSTRARELLTELTPSLLQALARTADPDAAFQRFGAFLASLPSGVPLFSLFHANPTLLDLVAEIMGDAPRLAETLSHSTTLLDSVLSQGFFDPPPPADDLTAELSRALEEARDYQEELDIARRWTNDQKFRVGVQTLRNMLEPQQAAHHLSDIADAALRALAPRVQAEFARNHGVFPGGDWALVAMGKMGSREMTANSDLDLILVYDVPDDVEVSDGAKPLMAGVYFSRLTQRMINAITAQTGEGRLYEVDMRLRPSGSSGPIATSLTSFAQYHDTMAWTWEHMALTRARVVTGGDGLRAKIADVIHNTLCRPRDPDKLLLDVADMRERIERQHHTANPWEVKHLRGGLVDIEFIAQYLQLRHAAQQPDILANSTAAALEAAACLGALADADAELLQDSLRLWSAIQQVLRQTIEGHFSEDKAPGNLKQVLVRATATTHFEGLRLLMTERAQAVHDLFTRLIDEPARPLRAAQADKEKEQ